MKITYEFLFPAMWLAYMIYWWEMSTNVKVTERRESKSSRLVRSVLIVCAYMLLLLPAIPLPWLFERILPFRVMYFWIGSVITAGGLFFSVWARCHLGSNWSQAVTIKENHQLITSGPNAIVRHPIYTGLLLGFVGNALARDEWSGLLAVALVFNVLWRKLRLEEKWMRLQFGESFEVYSRRVTALVPYIL